MDLGNMEKIKFVLHYMNPQERETLSGLLKNQLTEEEQEIYQILLEEIPPFLHCPPGEPGMPGIIKDRG